MSELRVRRAEWETFAAENPLHYICTGTEGRNESSFWQSGLELVQTELLPILLRYQVPRNLALELGCGVGRLAIPLGKHFQAVAGLDIAQAMVTQASQFAEQKGATNARFIQIQDPQRALEQLAFYSGAVDFVYSMLVFQHIDDFTVIDEYVHLIAGLLTNSGVAYLQFDTRAQGLLYSAKNALPDVLLPRDWRRGIRRVRRDPSELESCFKRHSLKVLEQITPHTELHRYILQRQS